jgi:hypothetical protein
MSFKRFIVRQGVTVALLSQTSGSFCGDLNFDAGCDLQGTGTTQRPLYLAAAAGGDVRGIKFAGDIYGPGTYLFSTGAASQVGDVWFSPSTQFDGIAADTASFLEMYATSSGQLFNVQVSYCYFEAINEIQAIYLHADTSGTTKGIDISSNWVGGMNISASTGFAAIYVNGCTGFNIDSNKFDAIIGTGGTNPAYIAIANVCSNFEVGGNQGTNQTAMTYGIYLDASAHNNYSISNNMMACVTSVLSENTTGTPSKQIFGNLLPGGIAVTQSVLRLASSGIPFVIAPTGSMANNGALTLGTTLPAAYAFAYVYLPAGAIRAASAVGWYFCEMSTQTAGTVFNNTYTSGIALIPASPTAFVSTGPGAFTGVITQVTGPQITIPANTIGPYGVLRHSAMWNVAGTTNNKTITTQIGGTNVHNLVISASATLGYTELRTIYCRGTQALQVMSVVGDSSGGLGTGGGINDFLSINFAANQTFALLGTLATATDFIVMEGFMMEAMP